MQVGDVVKRYPFESENQLTGKVIYIHPERRFYTVEFDCGMGRHFRQSYFFYGENYNGESDTSGSRLGAVSASNAE